MLDVASDGRYHMGIGIGGEFPKEFEACGVPVKQRASRINEALEVIKNCGLRKNVTLRRALLRSFPASRSRRIRCRSRILRYGSLDARSLRCAARRTMRDGWLPYMYTPEMLHESLEKI